MLAKDLVLSERPQKNLARKIPSKQSSYYVLGDNLLGLEWYLGVKKHNSKLNIMSPSFLLNVNNSTTTNTKNNLLLLNLVLQQILVIVQRMTISSRYLLLFCIPAGYDSTTLIRC